MAKKDKINSFNPNGVGNKSSGIFGLPFDLDEAELVIIPVPWDVTTSYGGGTSRGPEAVLSASPQIDLYEEGYFGAWKVGYAMVEIPQALIRKNDETRPKAKAVIDFLETGGDIVANREMSALVKAVNDACTEMVNWVKAQSEEWLAKGKIVAVLGGEHSSPYGLMLALADRHKEFAILQIDAHADLREAFEGFTYSHASIMYNAMQIPQMKKLVQVGIRDYSEGEARWIQNSESRIVEFTNRQLNKRAFSGDSWKKICEDIVKQLPQKVYVSFDIDGLDPSLCPHTGTPVPGGLRFEQAMYLIEAVVDAGREIIGFDLCEVTPAPSENATSLSHLHVTDQWDGTVGSHVLWRLCNLAARSQGKIG